MTFEEFLKAKNYTPENTPCDEHRQMKEAFEAGEAHKEWQYINNYKDGEVFKTLKSIIAAYQGSGDDMVAACAWLETACDFERQNNQLKERQRWHYPSKGELPEEFKLVAVSIKRFDYTTTGLYIPKKDGSIFTQVVDKWLCQIPYHAGEYRSNEDIIAWQYLPEPPKESV